MTKMISEPRQQISPDAVKVWRISAIIKDGITLILLSVLLYLQEHYDWKAWVGLILYVLTALTVIYSVYNLFIRPAYLQRTWRYDINEKHIQLKYGALRQTHLIVPMAKVQYVETNQGPLLRLFGLRTVTIGTMASVHDIPALPDEDAQDLRTRIALLAEIEDINE